VDKNFLTSALEDDSGGTSTVRLVTFAWTLIIGIPIIYLTLKRGSFPDVPEWALYIVFGTLGLKVLQKPFEKSSTDVVSSTTTTVQSQSKPEA